MQVLADSREKAEPRPIDTVPLGLSTCL
ncbi:hypothetical protein LEMLEM_LOCUS14214 [Lemmus lemmus]